MKCLQNPSPFSRFSRLLSVDKLSGFYSFWKWGALILALFASFTRLIHRNNLFIHQIPVKSVSSCQQSCSQQINDDGDFESEISDDDNDNDTSSSVAESHDEAFDSEEYQKPAVEVFRAEGCSYYENDRRQEGSFILRRRKGFPASNFSARKNVVQLWDSFSFGLDFKGDGSEYESEVAIWDLDRDVKISSERWWMSPVAAANIVATAEINTIDGGGGFVAYDDSKTPAIYAAWPPRQRNAYIKNNGAEVVSFTESDWELWSEADGVIGQKE